MIPMLTVGVLGLGIVACFQIIRYSIRYLGMSYTLAIHHGDTTV